ncbi:MAG: M48 family metalloprotease [Acetobacteraceae bacterium]|nr:M48 family metalloprotease [Acetobacteraceae bacterium]
MRATGLSTWTWNNQLKTVALLAGFPVLLAMMGVGLALVLTEDPGLALRALPGILGVAMLVAGLWFAVAWVANHRIMDALSGARRVTREEEPRLWQLMEVLCISRGEAVPRLAVIETPARNAFASGLSRRTGAVTVTRGLLDALDDRELSAVLAHELTHVRSGDARLAVVAAIFAGILTLVMEVMRFAPQRRSGRSGDGKGGGALAVVGLLLIVAAALLAPALRLALSRNREYLADAGAVDLTKDPDAMISALRKVAGHSEVPALPSQLQAMMLDWPAGERGPDAWGTHPPLEARIEALMRYAGGRDTGGPA